MTQTDRARKVELAITDLGSEGQGIGRAGDLVVFVPGALPGDRVEALVPGGAVPGRRFLEAELVRVVAPSPSRVDPACLAAPDCGGCQLLALSYPAQLEWKTKTVREALRRVGRLDSVEVPPCLGAPLPLGYRNKAQFPIVAVRQAKKGGGPVSLRSGLYRRGTHEVIPVEGCLLQHPTNNVVLAAAVRIASELGVTAYDEDTGVGLLRHVLARVSQDGRQAMAVLVTSQVAFPMGRRLAAALQQAVPEVRTVVQNINPRRTNVVLGPRDVVLSGPGHITDTLGGLRFRVSPSSFFQVNPSQTEVLYEVVARMASGAQRVADIYCGVGTITLFLAARLKGLEEIVGVELSLAAVRDAAANAKANGIRNAGFICGDAAAVLADMAGAGIPVDTVVLDPPRKGCEPAVLAAVLRLACRRVVYVSCNPATLARDLGILSAGGYLVREAQPVDMFPQTAHVECVARLDRRESGEGAG